MLKREAIKTTRSSDEHGVHLRSDVSFTVETILSDLDINLAQFDIESKTIENHERTLWLEFYKEPACKALKIQNLLMSLQGHKTPSTDSRISMALEECVELVRMLLMPND